MILRIQKAFQFTEYNGDQEQHYTWHNDTHIDQLKDKTHNVNYRKISTIVFLNDPNEYEGGDLEFYDYGSSKTR